MKLDQFLGVVPKAVRIWASVLVACALLIGLVAGYHVADQGVEWRTMFACESAALVLGILLAIWLLCLGFVYADARRRSMPPVLWVLVAALVPNLLGFLFYFVMRQPIAAICPHCGRTMANLPRFCPWCGVSLLPPDATSGPLSARPL